MEELNKPLREFAQSVSLKSEQIGALEPVLLERLNELASNPFKRYMLRDLINQMGHPDKTLEALNQFLTLGSELQDQMVKYSNQVVLLLKHVMPLDKLLALDEVLRDEFMEYGREVKKLVADYRIPLSSLLALEPEERTELIVNANYFSDIVQHLRLPQNVGCLDELLLIGGMGLTEKVAIQKIDAATQQLHSSSRRLFLEFADQFSPELLIKIAAASRNEILTERQATRIADDAIIEKAQPQGSPSPRKK